MKQSGTLSVFSNNNYHDNYINQLDTLVGIEDVPLRISQSVGRNNALKERSLISPNLHEERKFDSNMNIYIATDDEKTYYKFKEKYSNRIKFNFPEKNNKRSLRQTSLEDAIIDMYVCSFSKYYMGTKRSSFSRVIKLIKDSRI